MKKKKNQIKKPSYRQLTRSLKGSEAVSKNRERLMYEYIEKCKILEIKLRERLDLSMIQERRQLAQALAAMTEGVSHAIRYVVGKEVM